MPRKKIVDYTDIPETLKDHPFYGLELDDDQKKFRDAIWDKNKLIIFCDAKAGSGKTTIATGVANLLVKYGRYDGIVYIASCTQEHKMGFLPGDIASKESPYFVPFYQALEKIGENINTATYDDIMNQKNGTAFIQCMTHTYLRGCNFENKVIILDECQNYYLDELKKTLTRIHDNCKVIVIGHSGQIDLYYNPDRSGFVKYMEHFANTNDDRVAICQLTQNYRGWISRTADELD